MPVQEKTSISLEKKELTLNELEKAGPWKDPYAWVVLRLPKHLWEKGQETLENICTVIDYNLFTGEISTRPKTSTEERKIIKFSNIVNILHYMVDPTIVKPVGFDEVVEILKKDVSRSENNSNETVNSKTDRKNSTLSRSVERPPKRAVTADKYREQYIEKIRTV